MALVECSECRGVVSEAAAACPHCGHPNPAVVDGTQAHPTQLGDDTTRDRKESKPKKAFWPVLRWAVGFFVLGVGVNVAIEAAGIAISADYAWSQTYRSSWIRVLVPYTTAGVGGLVGLGRRSRGTREAYVYLSAGLTLFLATGIAVAMIHGAQGAVADDPAVASQSTVTSTLPVTTTTDAMDDWVWCAEAGVLREEAECDGETLSFDRWSYCLDNFRDDTSCDGEAELSWLLYDYYWVEQWIPLWGEVNDAFDDKDEARARILCQVAIAESTSVANRLSSWPRSSLRDIAVPWLHEMEVRLAACASGEWPVVNDSYERVREYFLEACPLIRSKDATGPFRCSES